MKQKTRKIENYIKPDGTVDFRDAWLTEELKREFGWKLDAYYYKEKPKTEKVVADIMEHSWTFMKFWKYGFTYMETLEVVEALAAQTVEEWEKTHKEESTNE